MTTEQLRALMIAPSAVAGGQEDVLFHLAQLLPGHGVSADVLSLEPGPLVDRLARAGLPVEVIDAGRLRDMRRFGRTARAIAARLDRGRYDVVFSNLPKAHLYVALAAARRRIPALWTQAGFPETAHWIDRLATLLPTAGVIACSRAVADGQRALRPARPVHLVHPGTNLARFRVAPDPALRVAHGISADAMLVSLVGRLQPWKGQREFLQAAAAIAATHPTARFAVVGGAILGSEGDYPDELRRLADDLGLEEAVTFTGHTTEVDRWMAASDIVVNASQPEPFGVVIIEAMASGCAVVAVGAGGPLDIIEHGKSGLLAPSRRPADLAGEIERLIASPSLRTAIGAAARRRSESHFSREAMAARFTSVVHEVTSGVAGTSR